MQSLHQCVLGRLLFPEPKRYVCHFKTVTAIRKLYARFLGRLGALPELLIFNFFFLIFLPLWFLFAALFERLPNQWWKFRNGIVCVTSSTTFICSGAVEITVCQWYGVQSTRSDEKTTKTSRTLRSDDHHIDDTDFFFYSNFFDSWNISLVQWKS